MSNQRHTDPTPQEIRKGCREIQERWDTRTERRRRGLPADPILYTVPVYYPVSLRDGETGFKEIR